MFYRCSSSFMQRSDGLRRWGSADMIPLRARSVFCCCSKGRSMDLAYFWNIKQAHSYMCLFSPFFCFTYSESSTLTEKKSLNTCILNDLKRAFLILKIFPFINEKNVTIRIFIHKFNIFCLLQKIALEKFPKVLKFSCHWSHINFSRNTVWL